MPRMTLQEYQALIAKSQGVADALARMRTDPPTKPAPKPGGREADLHKLILAECGRRNLVAFHGSTAHRTRRTEGEPDFVILLPGGRVLLIECKTRGGRLSEAQIDVMTRAALLTHRVYVVRSFQDFHAVLLTALRAGEGAPIQNENPTQS